MPRKSKHLLPGHSTITEFAKIYGFGRHTVTKHLNQGFCNWPRKMYNMQTQDPIYWIWTDMRK